MPKYVQWDDAEKSKGSGGQFLKLEPNKKYRIRLVSNAVQYFQHWEPVICRSPGVVDGKTVDPLMLQGFAPKKRYAIWVFDREDQNRLKVMDFPPTLFEQFAEWKANFNDAPGGANGPDWVIKLEVPGTDRRRTKYKASYLDKAPFSEDEIKQIKEGNLKEKLTEFRKENTPEEIRQLLAAKSDPTGPSATSVLSTPSIPQAPVKPEKPANTGGYDF